MKSKHLLIPFFALTLSSCGAKNNLPFVYKNGDLFALNELTYENSFVDISFEQFDNYVKSEQEFVLYLTSQECSHCYEFKDKIFDFVKEKKTKVMRLEIFDTSGDVSVYTETFKQILDSYSDLLFINGNVLTPQVYIVKGEQFADKIPNSRYSTSLMFKNAFNDYANIANVYSFSSFDAYQKFTETNNDYVTFAFDYANKGATNIYNAQIKNKIKATKKTVAIFEISENNKADFESFYDVSLNQYPFAINVDNNNETKYNFTSDVAQNTQFMDDSL